MLGGDGNFYGTTQSGGLNGVGTAFKITAAGVLTTLYNFAGSDGAGPAGALVAGGDGNFYGTTSGGGAQSDGTIFQITPAGVLTTLYNFAGTDGSVPLAGLTLGSDGDLYGVTSTGGANADGAAFKTDLAGNLTVLYNFAGTDGASPAASLTLGVDNNFYGTTLSGGNANSGTVFQLTPGGTLTTLYNFQGTDGSAPAAALTLAPDGSFYGTTSSGGANVTYGTAFQITSAGALTTIYSFAGPDGATPQAALALGTDGNFYGTTSSGGANSTFGTIFKLTTAGSLTTLYSFAGTDGSNPTAALTAGLDGNYYGTTSTGAANGDGSVFRIVVCPTCTLTSLSSDGTPSVYGNPVTLTATVTPVSGTGAPSGSVAFTDAGNPLGSAPVNGGIASLSVPALSPGPHTLAATYSGDATFQPSNGTFLQVVSQAASATTLTSSANPSLTGQPVTFSATVTAVSGTGTPTGTVTFTDGSTTLGVVALASGAASYTAPALTVGTHAIVAAYSGDTNYQAGTANLSQIVGLAAVTTKLVSSLNPSTYGQAVTFSATVAPVSGSLTPTGTVTFTDGSTSSRLSRYPAVRHLTPRPC